MDISGELRVLVIMFIVFSKLLGIDSKKQITT